ncbi:MAG: hypothetical protein HYU42_05775 [Candidatus Rokubacteria bacterium]|nr:hypothetical protein [Candidatus Rokubacteria bacterium]
MNVLVDEAGHEAEPARVPHLDVRKHGEATEIAIEAHDPLADNEEVQ